MCLTVVCCSLVDRLSDFKVTSIWIVEPLGFAYGIIAANCGEQVKKWINEKWGTKSISLLFLSWMLGVAYLKFKPIEIWGDYALKIILGATITAFIFTLLNKIRLGNWVNSFLAGISYEVYLLHESVFKLVMQLDVKNSGAFICFSIAITIFLSICLKMICNQLLSK